MSYHLFFLFFHSTLGIHLTSIMIFELYVFEICVEYSMFIFLSVITRTDKTYMQYYFDLMRETGSFRFTHVEPSKV